jgi:hypothetical protein
MHKECSDAQIPGSDLGFCLMHELGGWAEAIKEHEASGDLVGLTDALVLYEYLRTTGKVMPYSMFVTAMDLGGVA